MQLENLIVKEVWSSDLKYTEGTKILSKTNVTRSNHYATDSYSGATQQRVRDVTIEHIQEHNDKQYLVAVLGIGHFDDVEIYALKFDYETVKNMPYETIAYFTNSRHDRQQKEILEKLRYHHSFQKLDDELQEASRKTCWECGREFTYSQCKNQDGDWSESYCGC